MFLGAKLVSFPTPHKHLYAKSIPFLTYINASVCIFYQTLAFDKLGLQIDTILYSHDKLHQQQHHRDGDEEDAEEVDDDARLNHLRDGYEA